MITTAEAIPNDLTAETLYLKSREVIDGLKRHGVNVVSYACDGTQVECSVQDLLVARETSRISYVIPDPEDNYEHKIKIPMYHLSPVVMIQDSKHAAKTMRNNLFSGAHALALGNHLAMYSYVCDMAFNNLLSRTQISTQDVTQLCHEIRDMKKGPINNKLPDDLSKTSSNIPAQWDIRDKCVLGYAKNTYNKLCPSPPSDSHDSPARRDSSLPPDPPPPAQTPPGLPPFRTPSPASETSAGTPYVIVVPGSGESPVDDENKARNSPCESWRLPASSWE